MPGLHGVQPPCYQLDDEEEEVLLALRKKKKHANALIEPDVIDLDDNDEEEEDGDQGNSGKAPDKSGGDAPDENK